MSQIAKQISEEEAKTLRKLGFGDRLEQRWYLLPDAPKPKRAGKRQPIAHASYDAQVALTAKEMNGQRTYRGRMLQKDVYDVAQTILTTPGTDSVSRHKLTRLIYQELEAQKNHYSRRQVSNAITHLLAGGHLKYLP